jgi:hypothetical protein
MGAMVKENYDLTKSVLVAGCLAAIGLAILTTIGNPFLAAPGMMLSGLLSIVFTTDRHGGFRTRLVDNTMIFACNVVIYSALFFLYLKIYRYFKREDIKRWPRS